MHELSTKNKTAVLPETFCSWRRKMEIEIQNIRREFQINFTTSEFRPPIYKPFQIQNIQNEQIKNEEDAMLKKMFYP